MRNRNIRTLLFHPSIARRLGSDLFVNSARHSEADFVRHWAAKDLPGTLVAVIGDVYMHTDIEVTEIPFSGNCDYTLFRATES